MTRTIGMLAGALALLGVAVIAAQSALAGGAPSERCCACVELSGGAAPSIPAFFCGVFPDSAIPAAEARCDLFNTSDPGLTCVNATAGSDNRCVADLAEIDIACPAAAGVPAASSGVLSGLVALLGAGGYLAARRRQRQPRA